MRGIAKETLMKRTLLCCIMLAFFSPIVVSANSSWHWVTTSPLKALPLAVILTLTIETLGIIHFGRIANKLRAFIIVAFANIVSFIAPNIYSTIWLYRFYGSGWIYAWERSFNNGPNYIIRLAYLILTLCTEIPLVYFLLRNFSRNKKKFIFIIFIVNVITTIVVAVLERLICQGQW